MLTNTLKNIQYNKKVKNSKRLKSIFQTFCLRFYIEQQIPRPVDKRRRDAYYLGKKRKETYYKESTCG
jgi:hypothetical protein